MLSRSVNWSICSRCSQAQSVSGTAPGHPPFRTAATLPRSSIKSMIIRVSTLTSRPSKSNTICPPLYRLVFDWFPARTVAVLRFSLHAHCRSIFCRLYPARCSNLPTIYRRLIAILLIPLQYRFWLAPPFPARSPARNRSLW